MLVMFIGYSRFVIPANAGNMNHSGRVRRESVDIPASVGMSEPRWASSL